MRNCLPGLGSHREGQSRPPIAKDQNCQGEPPLSAQATQETMCWGTFSCISHLPVGLPCLGVPLHQSWSSSRIYTPSLTPGSDSQHPALSLPGLKSLSPTFYSSNTAVSGRKLRPWSPTAESSDLRKGISSSSQPKHGCEGWKDGSVNKVFPART